ERFLAYLRGLVVSPNGHAHSRRRPIRDKGIRFILETCRSLCAFGLRRRHFPPYVGNSFSELPLQRLKIQHAKPIFVFTDVKAAAFMRVRAGLPPGRSPELSGERSRSNGIANA